MKAIEWRDNRLIILDQTLLPLEEKYLELNDYHAVAEAIKTLRVRGAPSIGVAAAYGIALGALGIETQYCSEFLPLYQQVSAEIASTRPTAKNLFMAAERMDHVVASGTDVSQVKISLVEEAVKIHHEEEEASRKISAFGAELIQPGWTVLTHCNAGPLATAGYGTALGVIIAAHQQGKNISAFATETRPLLQGARLTALELKEAGIPFKLITDSMAGHFMQKGVINAVVVGADRIAKNGDTANKIGTYSLAVLALAHGIPFYVAAPSSTFDKSIESGLDIVIEERKPEEITQIRGQRIAPENIAVANPAFDVTPANLITAFITENGIIRREAKN
ncbi:MAG: S-methyl-5-thioribose-1-phosphate isomerase [Dehalococcoides mccartyi]|jgi:S-methyl-5-thioribose-1-phosphate isomerase|uniref:Methylthioribose-1-phosphate isomerase n=2 Tax=root TaxID=1 RepID=A0AB33HP35_9CHLR|nr:MULTISPECIES: S-methyl-5-thioribose-1-phosphate isomerase [Dehalococcoides]AQU02900.1 S-methyl-5-thioribose-1-phosphate isomerase [Dehalococcoides mccartyi]AQU04229.1 S-methyl-5-thioribose-1-phosphate isomerase [Dehalococcoides mccartyi]MBF4482673.1 S-methyl-5-thioribose-1-phosphate isomerase [Dehalococcoides mccartyi]MBJ7532328.1 S-methyl-5-thioribose-1-phosphate isomerase [Dehalococcoides mccartyi]MDP4279895.1 S-methyl-5-thioribose-1-phosphate isomerase [Dehalococcoides mccartyi]